MESTASANYVKSKPSVSQNKYSVESIQRNTKIMTNNVDNNSSEHNPVGRFMVAVGAVIANSEGQILLIRRSSKLDWHPGEWEIMYGRIAQHEDAQKGLAREVKEELGIEIIAGPPLTCWHIYRGHEDSAHNELIGITFLATTEQAEIKLSDEHEEYRWVTPQEALDLIKVEGIKRDIHAYLSLQGPSL
jgi:8-oxo-dGTP diphosphatase